MTRGQPRRWRVVLHVMYSPVAGEKRMVAAEVARTLVSRDLPAGLAVRLESIDRLRLCVDCGELMREGDMRSKKRCDDCVVDREIEREEAREARRKAR